MTDESTRPRFTDPGVAKASMPRPGQLLAERFQLERELGGGGAGVVFAAHDRTLDQMVAVKVMHPNVVDDRARARVKREVRAMRPGHPNAVAVYDLYEMDGLVFLAMELVNGHSLRELLLMRNRLEIDEVVSLGSQVAAALTHLHKGGLVHRDVKPGNILVTDDGHAKLCDMGLVRPTESGDTVTESAMVVGTPTFMAPEQAAGEELNSATDIYALGLTLFKCATGEVPLVEPSAVATAIRRRQARPPRVRSIRPECPRWLERLIRWMLEPNPRQRPSAAQVVAIVRKQRLRPRLTRRGLRNAVVVIVLGLAASIGLHTLNRTHTSRVELRGDAVVGVDDHGDVTWQHHFDQPIQQSIQEDLDQDGALETVIATYPSSSEQSPQSIDDPAEVAVITTDGELRSRMRPRDLLSDWPYPFSRRLLPRLQLMDVDRDGNLEVLACCRHRLSYPTLLAVYWPTQNHWELILDHPGYIYAARATQVNDTPVIQFLGVNNRKGVLPVFGEIILRKPGADTLASTHLAEPPSSETREDGRLSWRSYVFLDPAVSDPTTGDGIFDDGGRVRWCLSRWTGALDQWRNPVPGENAGRDLSSERWTFYTRLLDFDPSMLPPGLSELTPMSERFATDFADLLDEAPYASIFSVASASAFARRGDPLRAVQILRDFLAAGNGDSDRFEDAMYRLAHLEALTGELPTAKARLRKLMTEAISTRGRYDAPYLLLAVGIEDHDAESVEAALARLEVGGQRYQGKLSPGAALRARAHLWWDTLTETDTRVTSVPYAPAGDAIACLARWRLGKNLPGDPERMAELARRSPEARDEARLAAAAAMLSLGRPAEALSELDDLLNGLSVDTSVDFRKAQISELARSLRLRALRNTGSSTSAAEQAQSLRAELTAGLLPEILARELLQEGPPAEE